MIWIMCVFFAVFFAVSYATRSDEKIQAQRLKIIENCKLKQVEATSFDRQNGILTVVKRFGDCLLYTSPSPRDYAASRMPSSA